VGEPDQAPRAADLLRGSTAGLDGIFGVTTSRRWATGRAWHQPPSLHKLQRRSHYVRCSFCPEMMGDRAFQNGISDLD
jgi:hypothetical protein